MPQQRLSAAEPLVTGPNESILFGFDFSRWLPSGVTLSSVTSVTASPTGPTIASAAVNAATFVNGKGGTVAIGKGAQCRVSGCTSGTDYVLTAKVVDSASNTWEGVGTLMCRAS